MKLFLDELNLVLLMKGNVKVVIESLSAFDFEDVGILEIRGDFRIRVFGLHGFVKVIHEHREFFLLLLQAFGTYIVSFFFTNRLVIFARCQSD